MRKVLFTLALLVAVVPLFGIENTATKQRSENLKPYVAPDDAVNALPLQWAPRRLVRHSTSRGHEICYTMRSMLVAKESGSDATDVVGQRTCTPSSRFQMKSTVQQPK